jgi:predicted GH43/DUF377 family glycosyl hydrolase
MIWEKKGFIFNNCLKFEWSKSHAQVPVVDVLDDRLRIYYSTRNKSNQSNISFIDVCKTDPKKILYIHDKPILIFGEIGTFDDSGLMPTCIITKNKIKYLYYIGWSKRSLVPYSNSIGIAESNDGINFKKMFNGPIITVNKIEPYFSGTAFVINEENLYKMWYLSCIKWEIINDKPEPLYNIKVAYSNDGINWDQTGKIAIELLDDEGGLVSASVQRINDTYYMWYGVRGKKNYRESINSTYRIGMAISNDGINWERKDKESGITLSNDGWDSTMISYPYVIKVDNKILMFYNGNDFGKTGFGFAELVI